MTHPSDNMVTLRTGAVVCRPHVMTIRMKLKHLFGTYPEVFYEAVEVARSAGYGLTENSHSVLARLLLISPGGRMHDDVRAVLLASVDGEGADMALVSPFGGA